MLITWQLTHESSFGVALSLVPREAVGGVDGDAEGHFEVGLVQGRFAAGP